MERRKSGNEENRRERRGEPVDKGMKLLFIPLVIKPSSICPQHVIISTWTDWNLKRL